MIPIILSISVEKSGSAVIPALDTGEDLGLRHLGPHMGQTQGHVAAKWLPAFNLVQALETRGGFHNFWSGLYQMEFHDK